MLIYIHVPFCARRCSYCDFAISVRKATPSRAFEDAVLAEWRLRQADPGWEEGADVETIYFGGGTPSRLDPASLAAIIAAIRESRPVAAGAEITLEANPDDVDRERAGAWAAAGVNRISLGVQSFHPATLQWMHRTHEATQIAPAVYQLREAGFGNVSLDLIYGVPDTLGRDWDADLARALELGPEHLSLYSLTVEPGTPLGRWTARGEVVAAPDDRVAEEYLTAHRRLSESGFGHYEVSNAARVGFRAVHNAGYWERRAYLGLGPSAHSGAGSERRWNVRDWESYRRVVAEGRDPVAGREELQPDQVRLEDTYLGLRTDRGVATDSIPALECGTWLREGWATVSGGRVRLTPAGWLRLDGLVARLSGEP